MQHFKIYIFTMLLLCALLPTSSQASSFVPTNSESAVSAQHTVWQNRLDEINAIDQTNMRFAEKRQLRRESRSLNLRLREGSGGIYLSVGAIIIILLVLVILL